MSHFKNNLNKIKSKGFALIGVILILLIIGAIVGVGTKMIKPTTKKVKFVDTKNNLQAAVDAVVAFAAVNNRLPTFTPTDEYTPAVPNPNDAFGKPIVYIYDDYLAGQTGATVCGRSTAFLTSGGNSDIAFLLISGSDDFQITSTPGTSQGVTGSTTVTAGSGDIIYAVSLLELRAKAGCDAAQIKIVNNELPIGTENVAYSASVFAEEGVPFASGGNYRWCIQAADPGIGLTFQDTSGGGIVFNANCAGLAEASWTQSNNIVIGGTVNPATAGSYSLTYFVRDDNDQAGSNDNIAQRTLTITIVAGSGGTPADEITFDDLSDFVVKENKPGAVTTNPDNTLSLGGNTKNTYGCIWYPTNFTLAGRTMRAFFDFNFKNIDTHSQSKDFGHGFTFALMQGGNPATVCGNKGEHLGYQPIPGKSFAFEFDTFPNGTKNDPAGSQNHVAIVKNGKNIHGNPVVQNPPCDLSKPGCYYDPTNATWLEDAPLNLIKRYARIEIDATAGTGSAATVKAYICTDGTANCDAATLTSFSDLSSDFIGSSEGSIVFSSTLPAAMSDIKLGFTEGTDDEKQDILISNFAADSGGTTVSFADDLADFDEKEKKNAVITKNPDNTVSLGGYVKDGWGCLWYKNNITLAGNTLRAYFEFTPQDIDTHLQSKDYGHGFTFALMQGINDTGKCGDKGAHIGYQGGGGRKIKGKSMAVEFDTFPNGGKDDPDGKQNHVAIVINAKNKHGSNGNPKCKGATHPGCYYDSSNVTWLEDTNTIKRFARVEINAKAGVTTTATKRYARVEIDATAGTGSAATVKTYICTDGTANCDASTLTSFSDLSSDFIGSSEGSIVFSGTLPAAMSDIKLGFTEGTSGKKQNILLSNFAADSGGTTVSFTDDLSDFDEKENKAAAVTKNPDNTVSLGGNKIDSFGCLWYKNNITLAGNTLRAYFEFTSQDIDTHIESKNFGQGFTFALMEGSNPTTECGEEGAKMGYHGISGKSMAVEFDTFPNGGKDDPDGKQNHVAVVINGKNKHGKNGNPKCKGATHPACYYDQSNVTWLEDTNDKTILRAYICTSGASNCDADTITSFKDLTSDYAGTYEGFIGDTYILDPAMNDIKLGFTEGTTGKTQDILISNFAAQFWE